MAKPAADSKVVQINSAKKAKRSAADKWSEDVMSRGFVIIPAILLRGQRRLGLTPTQLAILLQLIDWWSDANKHPWSKKGHLAQRIGIGERQLQRQIAELEKAGFVKRVPRITRHGKGPNNYDLSGLVAKLKVLAPDFAKAASAKVEVEKPGIKVAKAS
jgi:predicted transcriptional regulator